MQTGEETAAAEEPILEEGSGREQVREGRSHACLESRLCVFARKLCVVSTRALCSFQTARRAADSCSFSGKTCV